MAQIKQTCSVIKDSQSVVLGGVNLADRIRRNSVFMIEGELVPYTVAADAVYSGGNTTVQLTGKYLGNTNASARGVFAVDMTFPDQIPVIAQGDVGTAAIFSKAMYRIQDLVQAVAPEGLAQYAQYYTEITAMYQGVREASETLTPAVATIDQKVTDASTSASTANTRATAAATSATLAQNWATATNNTFTGAGGLYGARKYATDAAASEANAKLWATKDTTEVVTGQGFSAKQYAANAAASATTAGNSVTTAAGHVTSAQNWATSLTNTFTGAGGLYGARKYANDASASATLASNWATATGVVAGGLYSAKYYSEAASTSAGQAAASKTGADQALTATNIAKGLAETAKTAAETAKTAAETARDTAQGHAGTALTQANRAQGYADQMAAGQVNADWNATDGKALILNKPDIAAVALPAGGTTSQLLRGDRQWIDIAGAVRGSGLTAVTLTNSAIATNDTIQTAFGKAQAQINAKANLASPVFTGTPTGPSPAAGASTQQLTPAIYVKTEIATAINTLMGSAPAALDTLNELATALGNDPNFATTMTNSLASKASLTGATFTGPVSMNGEFKSPGTFNINGSAPSQQTTGLYTAVFDGTIGTTGNPQYTVALVAQDSPARSIAMSVDGEGYLWGFRTHTVAIDGGFKWSSRVKKADDADKVNGRVSSNVSSVNTVVARDALGRVLSDEFISTSLNGLRLVTTGATPGVVMRKDDSHFYMLLTDPATPYGNFNALRPFRIDLTNGNVHMAHSVVVAGGLSANTLSVAGTDVSTALNGKAALNGSTAQVMNASTFQTGNGGGIVFRDGSGGIAGRILSSGGAMYYQAGKDAADTTGVATICRNVTTNGSLAAVNVFTANMTVKDTAQSDTEFNIDGEGAFNRSLNFKTLGVMRWQIAADNGGSSNFVIRGWDNSAAMREMFNMDRTSGHAVMYGSLSLGRRQETNLDTLSGNRFFGFGAGPVPGSSGAAVGAPISAGAADAVGLQMDQSGQRTQIVCLADAEGLMVRTDDTPDGQNGWGQWKQVWDSGNLTKVSQLTNDEGYAKLSTPLTGYSTVSGTVAAADTILTAFGKLQNQVNSRISSGGGSMNGTLTWATNSAFGIKGAMISLCTVEVITVPFNATINLSWVGHNVVTPTAATTINLTAHPRAYSSAFMMLELINGAAYPVTWSSLINWVKGDGSGDTTTNFNLAGYTLKTSGTDWILFWSRNGVIYGKVMR